MILGIIGAIFGITGFVLSLINLNWQVKAKKINPQVQARNNRLIFLADRIVDPTMPQELKQPFYDEYISIRGKSKAAKFRLVKGEMEKKIATGV